MIIEQIIEFELRGPVGRSCAPKTGYFYDKTKISRDKSSSELLFTAKILRKALLFTLLSPISAKTPTTFDLEMRHFKRALDLTCN